jgi:hypothetical protein
VVPTIGQPSARKKGIRRAAKLMFIGGVLLPVMFLFALAIDEPGPLVVPSLILFAGIVWALYCRLFVENEPVARKEMPAPMYRPNEYLPPAQPNPANVLRGREPNTSEIIQPPSVTEYTTNLLKKRNQT